MKYSRSIVNTTKYSRIIVNTIEECQVLDCYKQLLLAIVEITDEIYSATGLTKSHPAKSLGMLTINY